ncbi:hypothetical protein ENUP19_0011G0020 [Entamoeba nuttalli]|uniref:Helicase superfamily 3 single-stranded DNA/RNA virus domain-containing protein n=1 Tax=Entamoeba nuttalli TaxID=412467 RepID=A0ABQ0D848_9EUKA
MSLPSGARIEICKGSNKANIDYIKKDGNILDEFGEESHQGLHSTVAELQEVLNPSELNPIELSRWVLAMNLNQRFTVNSCYNPDVKVYYIWGVSGIGKSRRALQIFNDRSFDRVKFINNLWMGVSSDGQSDACIYDDFRDSHMHPSEFISFIDYYVNTLNIMNGHVFNNYKLIIITSIQCPNEIYSKSWSEESHQQWLRRMEIIMLKKKLPQRNIAYIKKEGDIIAEFGEEHHQGLHSTVAEIIEVKDPAELNPIELNRWVQAKNLNQRIDLTTYYKPGVKVFYVWGFPE